MVASKPRPAEERAAREGATRDGTTAGERVPRGDPAFPPSFAPVFHEELKASGYVTAPSPTEETTAKVMELLGL